MRRMEPAGFPGLSHAEGSLREPGANGLNELRGQNLKPAITCTRVPLSKP
jgi:hypothetical protein